MNAVSCRPVAGRNPQFFSERASAVAEQRTDKTGLNQADDSDCVSTFDDEIDLTYQGGVKPQVSSRYSDQAEIGNSQKQVGWLKQEGLPYKTLAIARGRVLAKTPRRIILHLVRHVSTGDDPATATTPGLPRQVRMHLSKETH